MKWLSRAKRREGTGLSEKNKAADGSEQSALAMEKRNTGNAEAAIWAIGDMDKETGSNNGKKQGAEVRIHASGSGSAMGLPQRRDNSNNAQPHTTVLLDTQEDELPVSDYTSVSHIGAQKPDMSGRELPMSGKFSNEAQIDWSMLQDVPNNAPLDSYSFGVAGQADGAMLQDVPNSAPLEPDSCISTGPAEGTIMLDAPGNAPLESSNKKTARQSSDSALGSACLRRAPTPRIDVPMQIPVRIGLGERFSIGRFDAIVGMKQSDFEFGKNTKAVSRHHAIIERYNDGYYITDIGSTAGTYVNDNRIIPRRPSHISEGDSISFGNAGADYTWECNGRGGLSE